MTLDSNALSHSFADVTNQYPLHLIHAFATGTKLVLTPAKVDGKSNEITAILALAGP